MDDPSDKKMSESEPLRINASIAIKETGGPGGVAEMNRETIGDRFNRIGSDLREDGTVKPGAFNCWRCCSICDGVGIGSTVWDADGLLILCFCVCNVGEMCCEILADIAQ